MRQSLLRKYAAPLLVGVVAAVLVTHCTPAPATERDYSQRREFHASNPCPVTGRTKGACPGYEVDHRVPLAAGGADRPYNMQWLSKEQHREKTRYERRTCAYGCSTYRTPIARYRKPPKDMPHCTKYGCF
jgi:hypothetical protein